MKVAYTLLADGTSDRVLTHVIDWILRARHGDIAIESPGFLHRRHQALDVAIADAWKHFGHSLMIVHRDAEKLPWTSRADEIPLSAGIVRAIPVRMTEAWLLGDEQAIRLAAGNPSGSQPLDLPRSSRIEALPDPKRTLEEALTIAAGRPTGRRLARLKRRLPQSKLLVAEYTESFEHLRGLDAFARLERELLEALDEGYGRMD